MNAPSRVGSAARMLLGTVALLVGLFSVFGITDGISGTAEARERQGTRTITSKTSEEGPPHSGLCDAPRQSH